jgi:hypothetical protein
MKRETAMAWADALESGEYTQCRRLLFDGDGYCCLGVLAKTNGYDFEEEINKRFGVETKSGYWIAKKDGSKFSLSAKMAIKFGIDHYLPNCEFTITPEDIKDVPWLINEGERMHLAGLNDNGESFVMIAKMIRRHWEEF